ncbi:MAG: hypothetical protein L6Q51_13090, partial [Cyclobacteriaceae bacterium]|nr:hypothetical protein [Cyclobacteriaceae bacterium]
SPHLTVDKRIARSAKFFLRFDEGKFEKSTLKIFFRHFNPHRLTNPATFCKSGARRVQKIVLGGLLSESKLK